MRKAAKDTNYVLEVHFWTDGKFALNQLAIPKNVEVMKASWRCELKAGLTNFLQTFDPRLTTGGRCDC